MLLATYFVACLGAWGLQDSLIYHPSTGSGRDPADRGIAFENVELTSADGVSIHGWYLPAASDRRNARHILFLHGNGGRLSDRLYTLETLHGLGHAVLIIDYRGYGLSGGTPSESGLYLDAEAAWGYLADVRGIAADDVIIYGRSLGGAIATALAARHRPGGLVLESTFTRLADIAAERYPWLPVRWLLRSKYDSVARVARLRCPLFIAHSPDDDIVPYALGRALAAQAPSLTAFVDLAGSHNRAFRRAGAGFYQRLDKFIRHQR